MSVGERLMTLSTWPVAVWYSRASVSSRVRKSSCFCSSETEGVSRRTAVGALLRLGFLVPPCCVFAGLRFICAPPSHRALPWADDHTLPHHEVRCAAQQS